MLSLGLYSVLTFWNDSGLQAGCLEPANAVILQVLSTLALASMSAASLIWSSGVMELFFSKLDGGDCVGASKCSDDVCGCYFRMGDVPSVLALAVPLSLILKLRSKTICTMRAAIIGSGYLSTVQHHMPYNYMPPNRTDAWSALGPVGFGCRSDQREVSFDRSPRMMLAKRMAKALFWSPLLIVILPLLFSSCSLIYRAVAIALCAMKSLLSVHIADSLTASEGMCGFYGMIFVQFGALYLFVPETWRLYYILSIQLKDWDGNLAEVTRHIKTELPEMGWALAS